MQHDRAVTRHGTLKCTKIIMTLEHWCKLDLPCTISIFVICAYMNFVMGHYSFILVLLAGAFAYLRLISVECYR